MSFKPMLATSETPEWDFVESHLPYWFQPKYDGWRISVLPKEGAVTRTLKPIMNKHVARLMNEAEVNRHLDGEIVTYTDGKPDKLNVVGSKLSDVNCVPDFKFHVFDHLANPDMEYQERYDLIPERTNVGIRVPKLPVHDLRTLLREEDKLVRAGWEGAILRSPTGKLKYGRATMKEATLLKLKRFYDAEAKVIGFVELMVNTNEKTRDARGYAKRSSANSGKVPGGTLGALHVQWVVPTHAPMDAKELAGQTVDFFIGTGFSAEDRQDIWDRREHYLGQWVTLKFQRVGINGKPLLPGFKAFRHRADMEDFI